MTHFLMNKFYVGATHLTESIKQGENGRWTHPTIEAAIEHARELMEKEGSDTKIIVQIIRIVRKEKPPVVIEVVE